MQGAMATLIGNSIGVNDVRLAKQILRTCSVVATVMIVGSVTCVIVFRYQLISLLTSD